MNSKSLQGTVADERPREAEMIWEDGLSQLWSLGVPV